MWYQKMIIAVLLAFPGIANAASVASEGSALSALGAASVVVGSVEVIAGSPNLVIKGVEASGEAASVVLEGVSEMGTVSVKVAPRIAAGLSKAVGTTVEVVTETSGYALIHSGKMIAFIPNELSKGLLHHSQHFR